MQINDNLLEFINVTKKFSNKTALDNVSFAIQPGRIIGLLGSNGSGKSTSIKMINGLLQPDSGQVLIKGNTPSIESKKIISYLPERTYLNDWMTVSQILSFFEDFYEDFDSNRAKEMLTSLGIDENAKL